jgi:hypothetical protein
MPALEIDYIQQIFGDLKGKVVSGVRRLNSSEISSLMWSDKGAVPPFVIEFSDGAYIIPMCDHEGNGAGTLCYADSTGFVRS